MTKNYYEILGVDKAADMAAIKKAYRALSMKHHPDKGGDEEKFKEISEAYSVLSSPQKRGEYDNPMSGMGGMGGNPFSDIFGPRSPFRPPDPNAPRRGRNIMLEYDVPLRYFIFGGELKVSFSFRDPCPDCAGTGAEEKVTCANCKGVGRVMEVSKGQGIFMQTARACPVCMGRGFTSAKICAACTGSGSRTIDKNLTLTVPLGAVEGAVIGAVGEGGTGSNGGPPGDLAVKLHIKIPKAAGLTNEQIKVLKELQ